MLKSVKILSFFVGTASGSVRRLLLRSGLKGMHVQGLFFDDVVC